jgi:hypothetical protein
VSESQSSKYESAGLLVTHHQSDITTGKACVKCNHKINIALHPVNAYEFQTSKLRKTLKWNYQVGVHSWDIHGAGTAEENLKLKSCRSEVRAPVIWKQYGWSTVLTDCARPKRYSATPKHAQQYNIHQTSQSSSYHTCPVFGKSRVRFLARKYTFVTDVSRGFALFLHSYYLNGSFPVLIHNHWSICYCFIHDVISNI